MSCKKDNLSMSKKSYIPYFLTVILYDFPCHCCFRQGKHLDFDFFIKFEGNIEKFEAENFSILPKNLMEKNRNPSVFPDGNNKDKENRIK